MGYSSYEQAFAVVAELYADIRFGEHEPVA
jgi:hypothetical protein